MEQNFLKSLIGLTKDDCIKLCNENNYDCRITREDGNSYAITCDLVFNRINLELDNGIVSACSNG